MTKLFLLLGGNLGDREAMLAEAEVRLSAVFGQTAQKSKRYETAAWGLENQPDFLNQALVFDTSLSPEEVLQATQKVEQDLGRERKIKWGARVIDIDLLFYGQQILNLPQLQLPHPQLHLRKFVLAPLAEIAPDWEHPVLKKTVKELLDDCPDKLEVRVLS